MLYIDIDAWFILYKIPIVDIYDYILQMFE